MVAKRGGLLILLARSAAAVFGSSAAMIELTMATPSKPFLRDWDWYSTRWTLAWLIPPIATVPTGRFASAMASRMVWAPAVPMIDLVLVFLYSQHMKRSYGVTYVGVVNSVPMPR